MSRRLLIADPSLKSLSGHHFETSVALAAAAKDTGFSTTILAHETFNQPSIAAQFGIVPFFRVGIYQAEESAAAPGAVKLPEVPSANELAKSLQEFATYYDSRGAESLAPLWRFFAFGVAVLQWAVGVPRRIGNALSGVYRIGRAFVRGLPVSGPELSPLSREILRLMQEQGLGPLDLLFIHTATPHTVAQMVELGVLAPPESLPEIHLLLRYDESAMPEHLPLGPFEPIRRARRSGQIRDRLFIYAETEALAEYYHRGSGEEIPVLPHFSLAPGSGGMSAVNGDEICCAYLGDAREEKGFHLLPQLIRFVRANAAKLPAVRFLIQIDCVDRNRTPRIDEAIREIEWVAASDALVEVVPGTLSSVEYSGVIQRMTVALLPYSQIAYQRRGSGILIDALCAGKLVIAPARTWVGEQAELGGGATFIDTDDLGPAFMRLVLDLPQRLEAAQRANAALAAKHSAPATIALIDSASKKKGPAGPRRAVLHIAPAWFGQGSTEVFLSQLRYLDSRGYRVYSVMFETDFRVLKNPQAQVSQLVEEAKDLPCAHRWVLGMDVRLGHLWTIFKLARIPRKDSVAHQLARRSLFVLPESLEEVLRRDPPAFAVVNYFYNMPLLERMGLKDIPVVLETHDVQLDQLRLRHPGIDLKEDEQAEIEQWRRSAALVAINRTEGERIAAEAGASKVTVAFPLGRDLLDLRRSLIGCVSKKDVLVAAGAWEPLATGQVPKSFDLLFVGTLHKANVDSLKWFVDRCFRPFLARHGITLVVAGNVNVSPEIPYGPGIFYTGQVVRLEPLYGAAKVIALPIIAGAGLPIKSIEAMKLGKCVAGVPFAFRGLPLDPGLLGADPSPAGLAKQILDLLCDRAARLERGRVARQLWEEHLSGASYGRTWDETLSRVGLPRIASVIEESSVEAGYEWEESDLLASYLYRAFLKDKPLGDDPKWQLDLRGAFAVMKDRGYVSLLQSNQTLLFRNRPDLFVCNTAKGGRFEKWVTKNLMERGLSATRDSGAVPDAMSEYRAAGV